LNIGEPTKALQLLQDIKSITTPDSHAFTETLIGKLCSLDDSPWLEYNYSQWEAAKKKISGTQLSNLLKNWELNPTPVRIGGAVKRGYRSKDLEKAFKRFLPFSPNTPESGRYTLQPTGNAALSGSGVTSPDKPVDRKAIQDEGCNNVTPPERVSPQTDKKEVIILSTRQR
jgi:hypothetical protein